MVVNAGPPLRVLVVVAHDSLGGAARAVYRIFSHIREFCADDVEITMRAIHKTRDDPGIVGGKPSRSASEQLVYFFKTRWRKYFPRPKFIPDQKILHSRALFASGLGREIKSLHPDVVMLGWLGNATLSIEEIGRIQAPVVWRLSDMWMFSGAEHYTSRDRYRLGYSRSSRPDTERGPDINRETFLRKKRHWKKPRFVISPSQWMANQVKVSTLTSSWPVRVIPNPIDTDYWKPSSQKSARERLGLARDEIVVLFGAGGGTKHPHKGADLLFEALPILGLRAKEAGIHKPLRVVIFGEKARAKTIGGIRVQFLGPLADDDLVAAYSAADVMVVPSRLDNYPSTALEAQACGCPVVGFDVGGLPDIVLDGATGALARPFDTTELAEKILWVCDKNRNPQLRKSARARTLSTANPREVAKRYVDVFFEAASRPRDREPRTRNKGIS